MKQEVSQVFLEGKMCGPTISKTSLQNSVWIMSKGHDEDLIWLMGSVRVWKEISSMLLKDCEHTEEAIMSQLTAKGNLASDACFFNEMSKTFLTLFWPSLGNDEVESIRRKSERTVCELPPDILRHYISRYCLKLLKSEKYYYYVGWYWKGMEVGRSTV